MTHNKTPPAAGTVAGAMKTQLQRPNYRTANARKRGLDRSRLPGASDYYRPIFGPLRPNGEGWALVRCPFHEDAKPSLSVHVGRGAYSCFACGAKGGDLIDFVMRRDGLDFKAACKALGAWR